MKKKKSHKEKKHKKEKKAKKSKKHGHKRKDDDSSNSVGRRWVCYYCQPFNLIKYSLSYCCSCIQSPRYNICKLFLFYFFMLYLS